MAEKIIKTRIINKHAVKADWDKATNFIPKKGEIIIYDDLKKIKIGDGETTVVNLDFMDGGTEIDTSDFVREGEEIILENGNDIKWQWSTSYEEGVTYATSTASIKAKEVDSSAGPVDIVYYLPHEQNAWEPKEYTLATTEDIPSLSGYATEDWVTKQDFAKSDDLTSKQDTLVSGTNIKTINGESILGSGDIVIEAETVDTSNFITTNTNQTVSGTKTFTDLKIATYSGGGSEYTVNIVAQDYYDGNGAGSPVIKVTDSDADYHEFYKLPTGATEMETLATQEWVNENMPEAVDTSKFAKIDSNNTLSGVQTVTGYYTSEDPTTSYTTSISRDGVDVFGDLNYAPYVIKSSLGSEGVTFTKGDYMSQTTLTTSYRVGQIVNNGYTLTLPSKSDTLATIDDISNCVTTDTSQDIIATKTFNNASLKIKTQVQEDASDYIATTYSSDGISIHKYMDSYPSEISFPVDELTTQADSLTFATREWVNNNMPESIDASSFVSKTDANAQTIKSDLSIVSDGYATARKLTLYGTQGARMILNSESNSIEVSKLGNANITHYNFPTVTPSSGSVTTKTVATTDDIPDTSNFIDKANAQTITGVKTFSEDCLKADGREDITVYSGDYIKHSTQGGDYSYYFPESNGTLATQEWANTQFLKRTKIDLDTLSNNWNTYRDNHTMIQFVPTEDASGYVASYFENGGNAFVYINPVTNSIVSACPQVWADQDAVYSAVYTLYLNDDDGEYMIKYNEAEIALASSGTNQSYSSSVDLSIDQCEIYVWS